VSLQSISPLSGGNIATGVQVHSQVSQENKFKSSFRDEATKEWYSQFYHIKQVLCDDWNRNNIYTVALNIFYSKHITGRCYITFLKQVLSSLFTVDLGTLVNNIKIQWVL